jgi:hypothetical protein
MQGTVVVGPYNGAVSDNRRGFDHFVPPFLPFLG